jgi:hypothetical protein
LAAVLNTDAARPQVKTTKSDTTLKNNATPMKVFITKFALTKGILEVEAQLSQHHDDMIVVNDGIKNNYFHWEGTEWHKTIESAKYTAERMRLAKIASLKKQIKKLETLKF